MIAKLKGLVDSVGDGFAVIDVQGVGYLVACSSRTLSRLGGAGSPVSLDVETQWREDGPHLYGFADAAERSWFGTLVGVQGVGGKVALAILGTLSPDQLAQAIAAQDKTALSRAPGVGPKLAARLVSELKDKVGGIALGKPAKAGESLGAPIVLAGEGGPLADAVSALSNLGYGRSEAFAAVARAQGKLGDGVDIGELIKAALKDLSK
ncbi:Holliday junction ATP-dependent DNA helicase RuvA [Rhodospirillaceae bacterium LM-1]|nr:Holliday junction ATP-dependent DNA helicase RuvA [Rhodospirillaceae bacterium LM-1]